MKKQFQLVAAVVVAVLVSACGSGSSRMGESSVNPVANVPITQALQGKIEGRTFNFAMGSATQPSTAGTWSVGLYPVSFDKECGYPNHSSKKDTVIFGIVPQVGKVTLAPIGSSHPKTITLVANQGNKSMNYIASNGHYEITHVTTSEIEGQMEVWFNSETYAKGTFKIYRCCWGNSGWEVCK